MNIFILSRYPVIAAQTQCDKHVVKMVLESAQLLCSPYDPGTAPYRRTHYNHRCSVWTRTSQANYAWLIRHAKALASEYTMRYGKRHKSTDIILWCEDNQHRLEFLKQGMTPFAQAMPDEYRREDAVEAYRAYYLGQKYTFAKWEKGREAPDWWKHEYAVSS